MSNRLLTDLPKLVEAGILTEDTAGNIRSFYKKDKENNTGILQIVLAVVGVFLVGLGILLVLAHNWDDLPIVIKTIFAFIPLLVAQGLTVFTILKRRGSVVWQESVGVFLFIAIAISISLISQIYHVSGNFGDFMLIWMLLALPIVYILDTGIVSLLFIGGITVFVLNSHLLLFDGLPKKYLYFPLLMLVVPYYYKLIKYRRDFNYTYFHHWIIPISLIISMIIFGEHHGEWLVILYTSLFGLFYLLGDFKFFNYDNLIKNAYTLIGIFGTMIVLFILSYDNFWEHSLTKDLLVISNESISALIVSSLAFVMLLNKSKTLKGVFMPIRYVFIIVLLLYISFLFFKYSPFVPVVIINALILLMGIYYIIIGDKQNNLISLNIGLLIIAILIIVRFFDYDISFLVRGIIFIILGVGFFVANYLMLKKKRLNSSVEIH